MPSITGTDSSTHIAENKLEEKEENVSMKMFRIIDEINGDVCVHVMAAHERSALKKFRTGKMTSGIYEIVTEEDGRPRLVSSYGSSFRADVV